MKATACAHPVQGLIKQALFDERLQIPFHDSISVCTAPLSTVTTFEFQEEKQVFINSKPPDPYTISRIDAVVSEVKQLSRIEEEYRMVCKSNFSGNMELEALSSGVAALALAAAEAAGLELSHKELSRIARKGTGSASGSVTGWFSRWRAAMSAEFSYSSVIEDDLEMGIVAALMESVEPDRVYREILKAPPLEYRLKSVHTSLYRMERAIKDHDIPAVGQLAEEDTVILHALARENKEMIAWGPDILKVIAEVKVLREEGVEAYFNIDTGAAVYINSYPEDVPLIEERINRLGIKTVPLSVGGEAHLVQEHL